MATNNHKHWNYKIANLRAIAILSVVIGHSIIIYSSEWNLILTSVECPLFDNLKHIINLYQMPLYFFISGYLMYGTLQKNFSFKQLFYDKVNRLIIPYFCVGLLWMIPIKTLIHISDFNINQLFIQIINFIVGVGNGHLWFLYSLFTIFLFFYIANRASSYIYIYLWKKTNNLNVVKLSKYVGRCVMILFFLGLFVISNYVPNYFGIVNTMYFIIWFYLGLLIRSTDTKFFLSLITLLVLLIVSVLPNVVYGLAIVLTLYCIVPNKENKVMSFIDKYSYGIYLFHSPLIYIAFTYAPNIDPLKMFFINFFLMGGVALLLSYIVKSRNIIKI